MTDTPGWKARGRRALLIAVAAAATLFAAAPLSAQKFELVVPNSRTRSRADLTGRSLTITDSAGQRFVYTRDAALDSADGAYLGFASGELRQAIRWPVAGRGAFLIGRLSATGGIAYRESRMQIERVGRPPLPRDPAVVTGPTRIATLAEPGQRLNAAYVDGDGRLQFAALAGIKYSTFAAWLQRRKQDRGRHRGGLAVY